MIGKLAFLAAFLMALPLAALAADEYKLGDLVFVSLTNATDGAIVQGANCTMTVINGTVAAYVNNSMGDAYDGTHYWAVPAGLVAQPSKPYRARVICNVTPTAWWQDFTYFYVVDIDSPQRLFTLNATLNASIGQLNTNISSINTTVWYNGELIYNNSQALLSLANNVSALPQACGSGSSNVTACGSGASNLTDAQVWNYADRNLTQNITQNLTAAEIWDFSTRTLTQNITQNVSASEIADTVWASATRTLTAFAFDMNVTDESLANIATAVWASGARTLTSFGTLVADIATAVWGAVTRTLTAVSLTNSTQVGQLENASANVTVVSGGTYYNTDNSTFNIILPISD